MPFARIGFVVAFAALVQATLGTALRGAEPTINRPAALAYLLSCIKENGAFGPRDQEYTDAYWNSPATFAIGQMKAGTYDKASVLAHGLGYPRGHAGVGHAQFFDQHQIRQTVGQPIKPLHNLVRLEYQGETVRYYGSPFGTGGEVHFQAGESVLPNPRDVNAESLGYYNLGSLHALLETTIWSPRKPTERGELIEFVQRRQAPGGGFVDLRRAEWPVRDAEASLVATCDAVAVLKLLGAPVPREADCIAFLQACQQSDGGFGYHPDREQYGNHSDLYYTYLVSMSLGTMNSEPARIEACRAWVASLQNKDGGFGDRPGWRSRIESTSWAIIGWMMLQGKSPLIKKTPRPRAALTAKGPRLQLDADPRLGIYQAIFKTPVVTPEELPGLAQRGIHLLGLKTVRFEVAEELLATIARDRLPMDVILCPEAYSHRLWQPGGLELNHVGNFTLNPRWNTEQRAVWQRADTAGQQGLAWEEYVRQVIEPMKELGSFVYPEQDFERDFACRSYGGRGYNAVLTGFNWAPRDFVRVFPWRERYTDQLVCIADVDAHGDLTKWSDQLDTVRNLFIGYGPTYADFQEAAAGGRVVCVIAQPEGVPSGATYYGPAAAIEFVKARRATWQWWKD